MPPPSTGSTPGCLVRSGPSVSLTAAPLQGTVSGSSADGVRSAPTSFWGTVCRIHRLGADRRHAYPYAPDPAEGHGRRWADQGHSITVRRPSCEGTGLGGEGFVAVYEERPEGRALGRGPDEGQPRRCSNVVDGQSLQPTVAGGHGPGHDGNAEPAYGEIGDSVRSTGLEHDVRLHVPLCARSVEHGPRSCPFGHTHDWVCTDGGERGSLSIGQWMIERDGGHESFAADGERLHTGGRAPQRAREGAGGR